MLWALPGGRPGSNEVINVARAVWSGSIGFGLVSIPVRLWGATAPKDVRFHEFDRSSGRRIRYRRVTGMQSGSAQPFDPATERTVEPEARTSPRTEGKEEPAPRQVTPPGAPLSGEREVAHEEVVKGYEVGEGRYVMVTPEELAALRPERSRVIEIQDFVSLDDIDPVYFDRSYLVSPQRWVGAEKPYALLLRAMQRSRRVGIGT